MKPMAQIFLAYAREDREGVEYLYQRLSREGFKPWMDKSDILGGQAWESRIQGAVRHSDFFLACLSVNSVAKRGFFQKEINDALDIQRQMLNSDIYLIPVRLEDCNVPECLRKFQYVNLFEEDGWTRLVKTIRVEMNRRERGIAGQVAEREGFTLTMHLVRDPSLQTLHIKKVELQPIAGGTPLLWLEVQTKPQSLTAERGF
jgi:hypothetical protein